MSEHENKYHGCLHPTCPICGKISPIKTKTYRGSVVDVYEFTDITLSNVHEGECRETAREYDKKRFALMEKFSKDKEVLLKPLVDKFNADLFLLDKEYLKGKIVT